MECRSSIFCCPKFLRYFDFKAHINLVNSLHLLLWITLHKLIVNINAAADHELTTQLATNHNSPNYSVFDEQFETQVITEQ